MSYSDMQVDSMQPEVLEAIEYIQDNTITILGKQKYLIQRDRFLDIPTYARDEAFRVLGMKEV